MLHGDAGLFSRCVVYVPSAASFFLSLIVLRRFGRIWGCWSLWLMVFLNIFLSNGAHIGYTLSAVEEGWQRPELPPMCMLSCPIQYFEEAVDFVN